MRALVLSGGGSKGAYEVGAVRHLMGTLGRQYDIFCGVSVGAINSAVLAQFKTGEEKQASEELSRLWDEFGKGTLYKSWFGWHLAALWKPSLYNSNPLQKILAKEIDASAVSTSGKKLRIGAVNHGTGAYHIFDEGYPELTKAIAASSAFPAMLTPVEMAGSLWTDGGVRSNTPIKAAIDLGATSIDVIMCSPKHVRQDLSSSPKTLDIAFRAIDLLTDTVNNYDLDKALLYNKLVKAGGDTSKKLVGLNIIRPAYELTKDPLDFDLKQMKLMAEQGQLDAEVAAGA